MATEKQIEANRENAKLGGVKTEEGKAISKYNALKHGILSREVLLEDEEENTLLELGKRLRGEINPTGEVEMLLTDRIIANVWRLRRLLEVERAVMEWQKSYKGMRFEFSEETPSQKQKRRIKSMIDNEATEKLLRYETSIERSIYRAFHELQRIQAARAGEKPPAPIAVDVDVSKD